jgi:hypothetical protein
MPWPPPIDAWKRMPPPTRSGRGGDGLGERWSGRPAVRARCGMTPPRRADAAARGRRPGAPDRRAPIPYRAAGVRHRAGDRQADQGIGPGGRGPPCYRLGGAAGEASAGQLESRLEVRRAVAPTLVEARGAAGVPSGEGETEMSFAIIRGSNGRPSSGRRRWHCLVSDCHCYHKVWCSKAAALMDAT